jgi:hypothetical protein
MVVAAAASTKQVSGGCQTIQYYKQIFGPKDVQQQSYCYIFVVV